MRALAIGPLRCLPACVLPLAACGEPAPDRALPGPCSASGPNFLEATYEYDLDGHLVAYRYSVGQGVENAHHEWTWTDGVLTRLDARIRCDLCDLQSIWMFAPDGATVSATGDQEYVELHEPQPRFLGHRFATVDLFLPSAPDSALRRDDAFSDVDITYTYDGPPRTGTRVRTGSDGSTAEFAYDDDGNLREMRADGVVRSWRYEGGVLVEQRRNGNLIAAYEHDRFGNLLRTSREQETDEYHYGCW